MPVGGYRGVPIVRVSVRVGSAKPDHRLDMKMLLLFTQICKCSFLPDLSNQSGKIAWLKLPDYRDYMHVVRWHRSTLLL